MSEREKALEAAIRRVLEPARGGGDIEPWVRGILSAALAMPATEDRASWEAGRDAAAAECERLRESYRRSLSLYTEDDPQYRLVKYSGATAAVCAENIRNLTPPQEDKP
jgi:hypothetical protein